MRDRRDLLLESFVKSNRLALMWGFPFGVGVALFGADLVHFVIGDRWAGAIVLIQAFGLMAAAVLAVRVIEGSGRGPALALAEVALYIAVTAAATILLERALLREVARYLRGGGGRVPASAAT